MQATQNPPMVIVGAGHCGGRAALHLRERGWTGRVVLVGDEAHPPYERPALSKELLTGHKAPEDCLLRPAASWAEAGIERCRATASALDPVARTLRLSDGQVLPYRGLLLATGGRARRLDIPGAGLPGVLALRTMDDAAALGQHLGGGARLLVVGGGFIGLEVAASARQRGVAVTLVEGAPRLMGRAVPAEVAQGALALHQRQGVDVRLGVLPQAIEPRGAALRVRLSDGSAVDVDAVVAGIGLVPAVDLAREAGLAVARGILVDAQLRTSADGVWAAGDVAEFPSARSGAPIRQETWHNAETQAEVAAANLLGAQQAYTPTPWFWSDQYDHQLQVTGEPGLAQSQVERALDEGDQLVFYLDAEQRLVGMSGWGLASRCAKAFKLGRTLVERRVRATPQSLADPAVNLKSLLAGA